MNENNEIKTKICVKCKKEKPVTDFYKNSAMADGLQQFCKDCHKEINKKYYNEHKDKYKKYYENIKKDEEKIKRIKEYRKKLVKSGYYKRYYEKNKNN